MAGALTSTGHNDGGRLNVFVCVIWQCYRGVSTITI
jgi:hypothetical protein